VFELREEDRGEIVKTIKKSSSAREINRAIALNMRDKGFSVIEIAESIETTPRTVINICNTYQANGIGNALHDDPRPGRPPVFDARVHTQIIAMVCSDPPEGFDRWTLDLLKEKLETDGSVQSIGRETIRAVLREHDLKPWQQKMWCIPQLNEEYIARMEDVLDMYEKAHNAAFPVVCIDEKPVVLHDHKRAPIPMTEEQPKKVDYEYKRCGTANVFCAVEPKIGRYINKVTPNRSGMEFSKFLEELSFQYSGASKIILILDNLSTHKQKTLIDCFGVEKGTALWSRFDVHYTPKHASWLNQAEIAIGMLQRQCLGTCRIPDIQTLQKKTAAWNRAVNTKNIPWSRKATNRGDEQSNNETMREELAHIVNGSRA
jgi:transposase